MALTIPPAVNYPSGLTAQPSFSQDEPKEGRKQMMGEILWATMGGANKCVTFNTERTGSGEWTQISSIKVDNSRCGADVTFIFPDTSETIVIPAQTPLAVVPVFSNSLQFYVLAAGALASDVTRFVVLNYALDPAGVNLTESGVFVASTSTVWNANGGVPIVTQLVPAGVNGNLQLFQCSVTQKVVFNASPSTINFELKDGAGTVFIPSWKVAGGTYSPISIPDADVRFQNGLIGTANGWVNWVGELWANIALTYREV